MKKLASLAAVLALVLAATAPALAQVPVAIVDCLPGGDPCIGTSGDDTINGTDGQDVILGLEGDDVIDIGEDGAQDFVFCGDGYDFVDQVAPNVVTDDVLQNQQGFLQYEPEPPVPAPDFIAEDCESGAIS